MAVFQKNDPDQAGTLAPHFDGALDEQCNEYSECSSFRPYLSAGKPVLNAEYQASLYPGFCSADNAAGIMGALYSLNLDGSTYQPCWSTTGSPPGRRSAPGLDRANPVVRIATTGLTLKRGAVQVRVACPRGQSYCDGTVEVDTVRRFAGPCARPPPTRARDKESPHRRRPQRPCRSQALPRRAGQARENSHSQCRRMGARAGRRRAPRQLPQDGDAGSARGGLGRGGRRDPTGRVVAGRSGGGEELFRGFGAERCLRGGVELPLRGAGGNISPDKHAPVARSAILDLHRAARRPRSPVPLIAQAIGAGGSGCARARLWMSDVAGGAPAADAQTDRR